MALYWKMKNDKESFEEVYEKQGMAIWTNQDPPKELTCLVESGKIKPCKTIDIGCGEGFYPIYLAKKGFEVTGIDLSENAIKLAKNNAEKAGVNIKFIAMDLNNLSELKEKFDFILEWAILHHIPHEKRKKYVRAVSKILNKNGKYLSTCFNIQNSAFGGSEKRVRIVPEGSRALVGSKLYFSSLEETKQLFTPYFEIVESKVFNPVDGREMNYLFMEKI